MYRSCPVSAYALILRPLDSTAPYQPPAKDARRAGLHAGSSVSSGFLSRYSEQDLMLHSAIAASATRMAIFIIQMTIGFDFSEDGDSKYIC